MMRLRSPLLLVLGTLSLFGCANYRDQLLRSQAYYAENRYEDALALLRNLDADRDSLERPEQVRYCYLRGMTDYRLGYADDARYWLGLAQATLPEASEALEASEKERLSATLAELNKAVFAAAAPTAPAAGSTTETPAAVPATSTAGATRCQWTSECRSGYVCETGVCVQAK